MAYKFPKMPVPWIWIGVSDLQDFATANVAAQSQKQPTTVQSSPAITRVDVRAPLVKPTTVATTPTSPVVAPNIFDTIDLPKIDPSKWFWLPTLSQFVAKNTGVNIDFVPNQNILQSWSNYMQQERKRVDSAAKNTDWNKVESDWVAAIPQETVQSTADLVKDIKDNWDITAEEIKQYFPEFVGKESAIADLAADIKQNWDITLKDLHKYYPELTDIKKPNSTRWDIMDNWYNGNNVASDVGSKLDKNLSEWASFSDVLSWKESPVGYFQKNLVSWAYDTAKSLVNSAQEWWAAMQNLHSKIYNKTNDVINQYLGTSLENMPENTQKSVVSDLINLWSSVVNIWSAIAMPEATAILGASSKLPVAEQLQQHFWDMVSKWTELITSKIPWYDSLSDEDKEKLNSSLGNVLMTVIGEHGSKITDPLLKSTKEQIDVAKSNPNNQWAKEWLIRPWEKISDLSIDEIKPRLLEKTNQLLEPIVADMAQQESLLKGWGTLYDDIKSDKTPIDKPWAYYDALKENYIKKWVVFNSNWDVVKLPENMNERALTDIMDRAKNLKDNIGKDILVDPPQLVLDENNNVKLDANGKPIMTESVSQPNPSTHNKIALEHRDYLTQNSKFDKTWVRPSDASNMYKDARKVFNETMREQINGLENADKLYRETITTNKEMKNWLINSRTGDPLANIEATMLGKGNKSIKLLDKIKEQYPDTYSKLQALKNTTEMIKQAQKIGLLGKLIQTSIKWATAIIWHSLLWPLWIISPIILWSLEDSLSRPIIERLQWGSLERTLKRITPEQKAELARLNEAVANKQKNLNEFKDTVQELSDWIRVAAWLQPKRINMETVRKWVEQVAESLPKPKDIVETPENKGWLDDAIQKKKVADKSKAETVPKKWRLDDAIKKHKENAP